MALGVPVSKATADLAGGILVEQNTLRSLRMALTADVSAQPVL